MNRKMWQMLCEIISALNQCTQNHSVIWWVVYVCMENVCKEYQRWSVLLINQNCKSDWVRALLKTPVIITVTVDFWRYPSSSWSDAGICCMYTFIHMTDVRSVMRGSQMHFETYYKFVRWIQSSPSRNGKKGSKYGIVNHGFNSAVPCTCDSNIFHRFEWYRKGNNPNKNVYIYLFPYKIIQKEEDKEWRIFDEQR